MDTRTKEDTALVVQSNVESKKGATFKVVSFRLSDAGVRALTSNSDASLSKVSFSRSKKVAAAA